MREAINPKIQEILDAHKGELPTFAWPGGYPLYYLTADSGVLCPDCANMTIRDGLADDPEDKQWYLIDTDAHWEGPSLICDHCNTEIESAYGDPDADDSDLPANVTA